MSRLAELIGSASNVFEDLTQAQPSTTQTVGAFDNDTPTRTVHSFFPSMEQPGLISKLSTQDIAEAAAIREKEIEAKHGVQVLDTIDTVTMTLEGIYDSLLATTSQDFTPQCKVWVDLGLEGVYVHSGLEWPQVSLEAHGGDLLTASLESVKGALTSLWVALKAAVKAVWDAIVGFFKMLFGWKRKKAPEFKAMAAKTTIDFKQFERDMDKFSKDLEKVLQAETDAKIKAAMRGSGGKVVYMRPEMGSTLAKLAPNGNPIEIGERIQTAQGPVVAVPKEVIKHAEMVYVGVASTAILDWLFLKDIRLNDHKDGGTGAKVISARDWIKCLESIVVTASVMKGFKDAVDLMDAVFKNYLTLLKDGTLGLHPTEPEKVEFYKNVLKLYGPFATEFLNHIAPFAKIQGKQHLIIGAHGYKAMQVAQGGQHGVASEYLWPNHVFSPVPGPVPLYVDFPNPREATEANLAATAVAIDALIGDADLQAHMTRINGTMDSIVAILEKLPASAPERSFYEMLKKTVYKRPNDLLTGILQALGALQRFTLAGQTKLGKVAITLTDQIKKEMAAMG